MKRMIYTVVALVCYAVAANAQAQIGGELINAANMKHTDAAKFSQTEHSFLSARVAGMGGAFTSLGADLSSMSINPAGLGMYRTSAFGISASIENTSSSNNFMSGEDTKFAVNQIGLALNLYQSSGSLVSYTFGFTYNKLADFNYGSNGSWTGNDASIADFFAYQMNGIPTSWLKSAADPFYNADIYPDEWGGVLAYQNYMINPDVNSDDNKLYNAQTIKEGARIDHDMYKISRGNIGEYAFASGFNIANRLYLGITLGIQDIYQRIEYDYYENYTQPLESTDNAADFLSKSRYNPIERSFGSGVNLKLGAVIRPTDDLRIGVAYHSPTWVSLTREYDTYLKTEFMPDSQGISDWYEGTSLTNSYTYNYSSPRKLLLGLSYMFADRGVISVDYDLVWYDGMRLNDQNRSINQSFRNDVTADLGMSQNFRAGLELRPTKNLYLRGGYAYYGSPFNDSAEKDNNGVYYGSGCYQTHTDSFSLGAGIRFASGSSFDVAWVGTTTSYTNYYLFSYYDNSVNPVADILTPTVSNVKQKRKIFTATYTMLF